MPDESCITSAYPIVSKRKARLNLGKILMLKSIIKPWLKYKEHIKVNK